MVSYLSLHLAD